MSVYCANKKWLVRETAAVTSGVYSLLSMIALWVDFTSAFSNYSTVCRIIISLGVFAGIALLSFFICLFYLKCKNRFRVFSSETGHDISIQFGSILDYPKMSSGDHLCSIVIPVNRCFDVIVDDTLVARSSLHGMFISSLIASNSFSPETLNQQIQQALSDETYDTLTREEKSKGNLKRFATGTVVNINAGNKRFFLLGLSSFNSELKAVTRKEEYIIAIQKLIEFCDANAQGGEVCIPIIGTGLSRVGISKNDALHFLFHTIILYKHNLSFDITIVVPKTEKGNISLTFK